MEQILIAVTGGIGSGKSYAINLLKEAGYFCISCDEVYADLLKERKFIKKLKKRYPFAVSGIFRLRVDKKVLAEHVFYRPENLKKLNNFTHPIILKRVLKIAKMSKAEKVFVEVPVLFESGYEKKFNKVIIISRNLRNRIESVKERSNLTEKQIQVRIDNQMNYDELDKSGYIEVKNDKKFAEKLLKIANEI